VNPDLAARIEVEQQIRGLMIEAVQPPMPGGAAPIVGGWTVAGLYWPLMEAKEGSGGSVFP
jgi:hypothetical protein